MEFWTKAMVAVVAVVVVVVAAGSVYTYGEEPEDPDSIEYKLGTVKQTASSSSADNSLLAKGQVWAYATVYVYNEEDMSFKAGDMPTLTLDGVEYTALYVKVVDRSDSQYDVAHYKLVIYYAVAGIYDEDGELVKDVTDCAELTLPDGWALRS